MTIWHGIEKRKYPGRAASSWEARLLVQDRYGSWFAAPAGERNKHVMSGIQLLPSEATWWTAWWWADPAGPWCAADVCTPPQHSSGLWHYDDLEIDVVLGKDGSVMTVDRDEFEVARATIPYPEIVAERALAAAIDLENMMSEREEPFGELGWRYLDEAFPYE